MIAVLVVVVVVVVAAAAVGMGMMMVMMARAVVGVEGVMRTRLLLQEAAEAVVAFAAALCSIPSRR